MKRLFLIIILLSSSICLAARDLSLTIYNSDFALVKDSRILNLAKGLSKFQFADVAATIEPSSVRFRSLGNPQTKVIEQNFQFDLVSSSKLLQKYIDKEIEILTCKDEIITGKLLRAESGEIIIQDNEGLRIISSEQISAVKLATLPKGLLIRPTLLWQIYSPKSGRQKIQLDYIANKIKWDVNYNAELSDDDKTLNMTGWVTITNGCGTAFPDAKVALIAGEVNRQRQGLFSYGIDYLRSISTLSPSKQSGRELSEALGEYRLYKLSRKTTIGNNQIKQIKLIQAKDIPVNKIYLYDGAKVRFSPYRSYFSPNFGKDENTKVNVIVSIENRADHNLGIALPPGLARIYKRDKDKSLEFIGEDKVPPSSIDARILLYIGDSFDITGQRTQTDFKRISSRVVEEAFRIKLKNHKKKNVTITVIEKLYRWSNWKILTSSHKFTKINSRTIKFLIPLESDSEQTLEYRVRYSF